MVTGRIDFVPTNEAAPHVIVLEGDGTRMSFACATRELAEAKLPKLVKAWNDAAVVVKRQRSRAS